MSEKERLVSFSLLGQDYSFYTGASEEEMNKILSLVRGLVENGSPGTSGTIPVSKTAILACLNIASRYLKLKQDFDQFKYQSEERSAALNEQIDARLGPEK